MNMEESVRLYEKSIFHSGQIDLHHSWQFREQKELLPKDYYYY